MSSFPNVLGSMGSVFPRRQEEPLISQDKNDHHSVIEALRAMHEHIERAGDLAVLRRRYKLAIEALQHYASTDPEGPAAKVLATLVTERMSE